MWPRVIAAADEPDCAAALEATGNHVAVRETSAPAPSQEERLWPSSRKSQAPIGTSSVF